MVDYSIQAETGRFAVRSQPERKAVIRITTTVLDVASERLTATVEIQMGDGPPLVTNPSFSEADLRALAKEAARDDYTMADVLSAAATALGQPELAQSLAPQGESETQA